MSKNSLHLSIKQRWILLLIAYVVIAFGQPVWSTLLAICAAILGYAIAWRALLSLPTVRQRFWWATSWYAAVSATQLSWLLSHHYSYIYGVHLFFSLVL